MTWSAPEFGVLARAASAAPSVHNTQPWSVAIDVDAVELYEQADTELPRHDPTGRDRTISCGAVLTNLVLAVRALGHAAVVSLLPDPARPELLARIERGESAEPSPDDARRYTALYRRRSYRAPFSLHQPDRRTIAALCQAGRRDDAVAGVAVRSLDHVDETAVLADLLDYAGAVFRDDRAYQRELTAWTGEFPDELPADSTLPWGGLVRADTRLPDDITLAQRLRTEVLLIVGTEADDRHAHLLAGAAVQRIWLTAVADGMAGSIVTQPLQLSEVRSGLTDRLDLGVYPQLILRVGYPVTALPTAGRELLDARSRQHVGHTDHSRIVR